MSSFFNTIKRLLGRCLDGLLMIALSLLVLDVVWGVFTRYVMGAQANWTEELARYLLIWVALLGAAIAFGSKAHLGVDYFVEKFDPEVQKTMAVVSHLFVLFFAAVVLLYGGGAVVYDSLVVEQITPALGWKIGYVYMALPISGLFTIMFTLGNLKETWSDSKYISDGKEGIENG